MRDLWLLLLFLPFLASCFSFHKGPMPGEPAQARFTDVDGVRVRFTDTGEPEAKPEPAQEGAPPPAPRPTVVLVHGFASALEVWKPVVPALSKTHRVITLDLKGFGWTDRPEGDYSPDAQARLVMRLLDQRGVSRTAIVAHSWGSSVALAATLQAPERVTRLGLYDAWVYEEQLPTFFHWSRADGVGEALFGLFYKQRADERIALAFYDKKFVTEALVEDVDAALDRPGTVAAALAAVRGQRYAEVETRYRSIDKPTLLLWGREDIVTPLRYGERLSRDLPGSRLVTYPRCGHFPMIEAIAASNRDIAAFLAEGEKAP
ncbi:MAG: alpha/beta fold hydrolase [Labilithrix sp.]|nr:alpha/beta fold hydrolase [Labilithrix sp.]